MNTVMDASFNDFVAVGVIVAHPDDETLWSGGTILMHPEWQCSIASLCRGNDPDRAPKYYRVLEHLGATGSMANLYDGPGQLPLADVVVQQTVLKLMGEGPFDCLFTHGPDGEYTRHLRHIELFRAVVALWAAGKLRTRQLRVYAFEDGNKAYLPRARADADVHIALPSEVWEKKYRLIHEVYGFTPESWEARTTPRTEAFWGFDSPDAVQAWLKERQRKREDSGSL